MLSSSTVCQTKRVGINRKRVALCGEDQTLTGALRVALSDHVVSSVADPLAVSNGEVDVLAWHFSEELAAEDLARVAATTPTLVIANSKHVLQAVDAGCRGFLPKTAGLHEIREGILIIADGGAVVPPDLLGTLLRHLVDRGRGEREFGASLEKLTARERDVFRLASRGARKEEIGASLFISPATARTHLQRLYRKLEVHSQAELIALAVRIGEFDLEERT
jgi:DNA-binding NarL/FixJ family response regulator